MHLSVIIKCLNGADTLPAALDSLLAQQAPFDWEILLSDNGSTDGTRAVFADFAARHPERPMRIIDASDQRGKSHALNRGIAAARADRFVFLDADDSLAPGYLVEMAAALAHDPFVAARMDIRALNSDARSRTRVVNQSRGLQTLLHAPHCPHAGGATLGFHRRVFDAVGGFDPAMTCLEDTDFCIRAYLAGFRLGFVPDAVYNYRFRETPAAVRRQAADYARARAQLRSRYDDAAPFLAPRPWLGLLATFATLGFSDLRRRVTGRRRAADGELLFQQRLGRALGELQGARAFRVPPPPSRAEGLSHVLRRPVRALRRRVLASLFGSIVAVRTDQKVMALTFDDGPDPETTPRLLDALARVGAKATFFVIGSRAARHPDLIARIAAEGHEIGNHSWDHPSLPRLSRTRVTDQLRRCRDALAPKAQAWMRPPYGDQTPAVFRAARRLGYGVVLWSISAGDWRGEDAETLANRVLADAKPGAIVLMHDSLYSFEDERFRDRSPTIEAASRIVTALPDYRFVTVSDLLAHGPARREARFKATSAPDLAALGFADPRPPTNALPT